MSDYQYELELDDEMRTEEVKMDMEERRRWRSCTSSGRSNKRSGRLSEELKVENKQLQAKVEAGHEQLKIILVMVIMLLLWFLSALSPLVS